MLITPSCFRLGLLTLLLAVVQAGPLHAKDASTYLKNVTVPFETIYYPEEARAVTLSVQGRNMSGGFKVDYTITDFWGNVVEENTQEIGGLRWERIEFDPAKTPLGWYRAKLDLKSAKTGALLDSLDIDFAVIPRPAANRDPFFAVSGPFSSSGSGPNLTDSVLVPIERSGATWVRCFLGWTTMQDTPGGSIDWGRVDRSVDACERYGIKLLVSCGLTPRGLADPAVEPPTYRRDELNVVAMPPLKEEWERVTREAASRYKGRVGAWELWNEPNAFNYWALQDPESYGELYLSGYKSIREVDDSVRIVMGGLSGVKAAWIEQFAEGPVGPALSTVNIHPYRFPSAPPEKGDPKVGPGYGTHSLIEDIRSVWAVMDALPPVEGPNARELWVTEAGYNTLQNSRKKLHAPISEADQAALLVRTMTIARSQGVNRFFWWRLFDTYGAGLGLLRNQESNFEPKPSYVAYATLARKMADAGKLTLTQSEDGDIFLASAEAGEGMLWVVWSLSQSYTLLVPEGGRAYNLMGGEIVPSDDGSVAISSTPVYLETGGPLTYNDVLDAIEN